MKRKNLRQSGHAAGPKGKRIGEADLTGSTSDQAFRWDASLMDVTVTEDDECAWTWQVAPADLKDFLGFLTECGQRTWGELEADRTGNKNRHKKHHSHGIDALCPAAQARLRGHVDLDESFDSLYRLRYGGTKRVWGVRDRATFRLIWLDLDHQVYPTEPE